MFQKLFEKALSVWIDKQRNAQLTKQETVDLATSSKPTETANQELIEQIFGEDYLVD